MVNLDGSPTISEVLMSLEMEEISRHQALFLLTKIDDLKRKARILRLKTDHPILFMWFGTKIINLM